MYIHLDNNGSEARKNATAVLTARITTAAAEWLVTHIICIHGTSAFLCDKAQNNSRGSAHRVAEVKQRLGLQQVLQRCCVSLVSGIEQSRSTMLAAQFDRVRGEDLDMLNLG